MRSSTVLLLFLCLGILLISIFHLQYDKEQLDIKMDQQEQQLIQALENSIALENQRAKESYQQFRINIDRMARVSNIPIIKIVDSLRIKRKEFNDFLFLHGELQTIQAIETKIQQEDILFFNWLDQLMKDKRVRVREKERENIRKECKERYKIHQSKNAFQFTSKQLTRKAEKLNLLMVHHDRLNTYHFFENLFLGFMGFQGCRIRRYFPIINPQKTCLKKGDHFEATIHIGSFSSTGIPAEIVINGDTLAYNTKENTALYKYKPSKSGTHELNIQCQMTNPLSGEVYTETSTFEYEVQ